MKLVNKFISIFFATAYIIASNPASAAELTLRSNISITGDIVTLGDLFENAGAATDIAVFRSPAPGKNGILKSRRIKTAARDHGLNWLNTRYLENIVIHREAQTISLDEIRNRIGERIGNDYPRKVSNSQLEISLNQKARPFVMRADVEAGFEIERIRFDARSGQFSAVISGPVGTPNAKRIAYRGRATEVIEVPVLAQALARGQTIRPNHLETKKIPARRIGNRTVTEAVDLIGMALRRSLRPNSLIRRSDVEKPRIVTKNTLVSVVYKIKTLQITFRGRALEDGALGETVTILNPRSRRTIQAVVTAPNVVTAQGNQLRQTASLSQ